MAATIFSLNSAKFRDGSDDDSDDLDIFLEDDRSKKYMEQFNQAVGILGGTFDPIHLGHLHIAEYVFKQTPIKKIKILPCYQPVHKELPQASAIDRAAMIKLAIGNIPYLELDESEIIRKEPSYMIDTLRLLRAAHPLTPFSLILGSDVYQQITTWKSWQQLLNFAHFLVLNRPNFLFKHPNPWLQERETQNAEDLTTTLSGKIYLLAIPVSFLSATDIRNRILLRQEIISLLPPEVVQYIKEKKLYTSN